MNYSGNMPDWHQYNPPQSGISDVTSTAQNVNSGHLSFISSISPTQLNSLNLSSEGHEKHQNDTNFNPRHFQTHLSGNIAHGHNATDNTPLASMVQMQNCIGHYGPSNTRNPIVDNLNPMDPRNNAIGGINEELGYRNNQVPLNGPISHLNGPNVMNMNAPHGSIGTRNTNVNTHASSRAGLPSFVPCKGLCCNPDPNISYQQWEKYCSYQNNTTYRDNIRSSGYQTDARRFSNDFNFRKDNFDGKEVLPPIVSNAPSTDHRRNFSDFKYRKDRLISRSYQPSSGMLQNYPVQNYNYTGEYQKYPYNVKDYSKMNSMSIPNQGIVKHQEQGFIPQQKYNSKQVPYQNSSMMPSSIPTTNVNPNMIPPAQNTYFNPQYPRNLSTETSHDCQENIDNISMANRMQTSTMHASHSRYQMYQQKIAMQRFSMENHLRELTKIPGYQSHPKYKECVLRYREILKMQQSVTYQGQIQQTSSCVTASPVNPTVPPINLQFDQNGVLINSNYMSEAFPRVQQVLNPQAPVDNSDKQNKQENSNNIAEMMNHNVQKPEQLVSQQRDPHATTLCSDNNLQKQERYAAQKTLEQNQFEVQKTANESFNNLNTNSSNTTIQQKISKEFANKPELDVRQFLANWDESEDEDGTSSNVPNVILNDSTPVVVVGYENVDLTTKTLQNLEGSKPEAIPPNVITFENRDKNNVGAVPAQDCLTISYSSTENVEIAKNACKEITKESIVQSGSIIQCISNGPDEVPTIHIVDNLEISGILQVTNGQVAETLERQNTVPFFHERTEIETSAIILETDKFKKTDSGEPTAEYNANLENLSKEKYVVKSSSPAKTAENTSQINNQQEIATLPASTSVKNNLESAQDMNLKKQNSFNSEESHNPDDISLPDLPTSECTPISTTLNTPIHSDSEESSERVEDLTIPTNPIEVVQNSPIISFTQSPMGGEPYDHLNNEGTAKNKSAGSLESQYQTENHFKDNGSNNMLDHGTVLSTFEFSTNIDKNEFTVTAKDGKERANSSGSTTTSTNSEKAVSSSGETENTETTGTCMTLTSGEYELKIVSTSMQNKTMRDYKNSTTECPANESQAVKSQNTQVTNKKLQVLPETSVKPTLQYNDSIELDKALQNIANKSDFVKHDGNRNDINYVETCKARLKVSKNEEKSCAISVSKERKCISTESTHQTTANTINLPPTNEILRSPRSAVEDSSTKIAKDNPSHSTKNSTLSNDKLRRSELTNDKSGKEDSILEKNDNENKLLKIKTKNSKNSQHINRLTDLKRSTLTDQTQSHDKRCFSESTPEKCTEMMIHHNKHTQEMIAQKAKSHAIEAVKESDVSQNESKIIDNNVDDSRERLRSLKEYRKTKYKPLGETSNKIQDTQETSDYKTSNKSPNSAEQSESQVSNDKQICQKDVRFKSSEEQNTREHGILKTFVSKNINPDFAIQVTNVNLKLKDNDQKESQQLGEETKSSGSLDAIKIEINVSCTERNTTEKLLHENIKNAVAETIGHLTSSISNGARSSSTCLTEIQCDKRIVCDKADPCDYEKNNRSSSVSAETSTYNEIRIEQNNTDMVKYESAITAMKKDVINDEISSSLISKKRKSLSSEGELINNMYEGNDNIEAEPTPNSSETPKSGYISNRRKSVLQDAERKIAAAGFSINTEEPKNSLDILSCIGSTSRNINAQKKEHQEISAAFPCRNARNLQNRIASTLNAGPSTSSGTVDSNLESACYDNPKHFDYNHFDVAPNENADADDKRVDKWKKPKRDDGRYSNFDLYDTASGYMNPIFFSVDELKDLNTVPVYTTKDGKITYSPNPRFTYRELIMEARAKGAHSNTRESYFSRSLSFDYYNCTKLRKIFKRNRDITNIGRKKEIDCIDTKFQFAMKHTDYLPNKNAAHKNTYCAKVRSTPHLEFFNDDADKLYTSRSGQQETKESNKKNIVDLSFLEKSCNPDGESSIKHSKTKVFTDNLEKECNESSVFDSNLLLGPRASCWEETMESVKSYSSHIDRRSSDNFKELNFNEIFATQKRSDSLPFLSAEQNSSDGNGNSKPNNNCNMADEPVLSRSICNYTDDLICNNNSRCEQANIILRHEQINKNEDHITLATEVYNKSMNMHNASSHDEYAKKQQTQSDEIKSDSIIFTEKTLSCSPKTTDKETDKETNVSENHLTNNVKDSEILTEHSTKDDTHVHCTTITEKSEDNAEDTSTTKILDKNYAKVASPCKPNANSTTSTTSKDLLDELKCAETRKESSMPALNEPNNEANDFVKNNTDFTANKEIVHQQVSSADCKNIEEVTSANVSTEIYFEINERNDTCDEGNSTVCKEKEPDTSQTPLNITALSQSFDDENNEEKLQKLEDEKQLAEDLLKNERKDEIDDNHSSTIMLETTATLDLHSVQTEENVCDIFTNEKREQNISEFTVIKSIIKPDKTQCQEPETKENSKDCDNIIDSKLLCMDSSDCGIYTEDRCALEQISGHDFTEEDSIVPMEWETSQIQEDAVNRLCNIDDSSIDFAAAANSLQDNSLLDNLSLSGSTIKIKESRAEVICETENKSDEPVVESVPLVIEESKTTSCEDENKEQNQVSSSNYEKVAYLRATDCNANTKIVPKLVIKKTETSSKFITKISSSSVTDNIANTSIVRPICQPKIPKMIIRNARSRPGTPSIEAVPEEVHQINILNRASFMHNEIKEELYENDSESSLQGSSNYRNKIPKMKIKLDEKHSNKIVRTEEDTAELCSRRRNIKRTTPKVKIKNSPKIDVSDNLFRNSTISEESKDTERYEEKIPILKLRKQERNRSSSPEVIRKRQNLCHSEIPVKKCKKLGRDETGQTLTRHTNSDSARTTVPECETKKNPLACISEKIPKVIIKRTSASAEFKCELSKSCKNVIAKSAKWQPEVKLERYRILDGMVKDLKSSLNPISWRIIDKIFASRKDRCQRKDSEHSSRLSRSSSTSNLLPAKCKQRRMSDYDYRKGSSDFNFTSRDMDSRDTKKEWKKNVSSRSRSRSSDEKDNKSRSRSRDNKPRIETDVILSNKNTDRSVSETSNSEKVSAEQVAKTDEDTLASLKIDQKNLTNNSMNFKSILKDRIEPMSKIESCFVKLPDLSGTFSTENDSRKEQEDDPFSDKNSDEAMIKKEQLNRSNDMDNEYSLQEDIQLLKDDPVSILDNFEMSSNTVIKVESSDDSQSTIEILPASPDHSELESHIIEDGDSEHLYPADAIPTQFELELEITDNSNIDLLDVPMPKLDLVTCCNSRRASINEYCSDPVPKVGCHNKFVSSSRGKSPLDKAKHMEIDINGDDGSISELNKSVCSAEEISSKSPCNKKADSTVMKENFCCNDSLVKEVLAAKETLKKCLSRSQCGSSEKSNIRPKTAAEKKQGSSFDLNSLPEMHSKSSDSPQDHRGDITSQVDSVPTASKHNKTESLSNAEKSDKKHSKQNKNTLAKKKARSPEKKDDEICPMFVFADSKQATIDTHECTTISLKAFKQFGKTASKESVIRNTINLSEKRKKNSADQSDTTPPQSRDPQRKDENKLSSYKIPKISKSVDHGSNANSNAKEIKSKEDNMPILEPEITVNFDASSDRDSSRSPPVITNQDSADVNVPESKLIDDEVIKSEDKIESDMKDLHKKSEMSIADFVTQLAFHEKATIKHRKYCNLCERWFPTTSRHRRHLAGYQHRHIELTQRKSIHAMFMVFTGKPCPRLLPANVMRNDCSVGELTPLQIAVQDITRHSDHIEQNPKKQNNVDK